MRENQNEPKVPFKDSLFGTAAILTALTVAAVFALSLLHSFTEPVIERRLQDEKDAAVVELFGAGIDYEALAGFEEIYSDFDAPVSEVLLVSDEHKPGYDKTAGYCVMVEPKGFANKIIMLVAVNPNVTVKGTLILSMSETAGYGTKIDSGGDGWFREQFKNKTRGINDIRIEPEPDENEIQIIVGATVSSRAFLKGVNTALEVVSQIKELTRAAQFEDYEDYDEYDEYEDLEEEVENDG